jgi:SAM-dependent methyltransferase
MPNNFSNKEPWFYSRQLLKDNAQFIKGDVIDVGCGDGKHKEVILGLPNIKSYTGLEQNFKADIQADLNKRLPIEDNKYDTAILISVLEHLLEPQNALNEIARILKPNGYLLLTTVWVYPYHEAPGDYFRYNDKALEYLLGKAGFKVEKVFSLGGTAMVVFTILRRQLPFLNKISPVVDKLLSLSRKQHKNTPAYFIVARKK